MGLRALKFAAPFIIGIVLVMLLLYFVIPANGSNRGEPGKSGILTTIPERMPPLPTKSRKPFSPFINATIGHDSIIAR